MLFRFHFSGSRFRSFPCHFRTLRGKQAPGFHSVSASFPTRPASFLFLAYRGEIRKEAFLGGARTFS